MHLQQDSGNCQHGVLQRKNALSELPSEIRPTPAEDNNPFDDNCYHEEEPQEQVQADMSTGVDSLSTSSRVSGDEFGDVPDGRHNSLRNAG